MHGIEGMTACIRTKYTKNMIANCVIGFDEYLAMVVVM